jgi:hypothetical protein
MAGLGLLTVADAAAGVHVSRIAINPILAPVDPVVRRRLRVQGFMTTTFGRIGPVRRAVIRQMGRRATAEERMTAQAALTITEQTSRLTASQLSAVLFSLAGTPAITGAQQRCAVIACTDDPWMSDPALDRAIAEAALEPANVHRFPNGGHHPHLELADRLDHSARNAADIVRIIDAMLLTAAQSDSTGSSPLGLDSTLRASASDSLTAPSG